MQPQTWDDEPNQEQQSDPRRDRVVALTVAVAIIILIVTFVILFVRIDPLLEDFTSSGAATPTVTEPTTVP